MRPLTGNNAPGLAQIVGLAGIGKTLLAEEYGLRFGPAYPGGVFWLRASGDVRDRIVRALAQDYHVPLAADAQPNEVVAALRWRIEQRRERCLWIVDDVPDGLTADQFRSWLAPHPLAATLITTQSRAYAAFGAPQSSTYPHMLSVDDAFGLLATHRSPIDDQEKAEAQLLANDLGHHPLALDIAGAAVAHEASATPYATFRVALAEPMSNELELAAELADPLPTGHERSIAATFSRAIAGVGSEGTDMLRLAAVVAAAPLPAQLVDRVLARVDGLDERAGRTAGRRARRQLEGASLAERVGGELLAHSVHGLVTRYIGVADESSRVDDLRAAATAVLLDELRSAGEGAHLVAEPLVSHAAMVAQGASTIDEARLLSWVGSHEYWRGAYASAASSAERSRTALSRLLGSYHPDAIRATENLASAIADQGDLKRAAQVSREAVAAGRAALGWDHPTTITATTSLAFMLLKLGSIAAAQTEAEAALAASQRVHGPLHETTLIATETAALVAAAQGKYLRAHLLQQAILDQRLRTQGPEHPDTLRIEASLAMTLGRMGLSLRAGRLLEEAAGKSDRIQGPEHPTTLQLTNSFAVALWGQGQFDRARDLQESVLAVSRRVVGADHPNTLLIMGCLATTLDSLGELAESRKLHELTLDTSQRVLGPEHPETLRER